MASKKRKAAKVLTALVLTGLLAGTGNFAEARNPISTAGKITDDVEIVIPSGWNYGVYAASKTIELSGDNIAIKTANNHSSEAHGIWAGGTNGTIRVGTAGKSTVSVNLISTGNKAVGVYAAETGSQVEIAGSQVEIDGKSLTVDVSAGGNAQASALQAKNNTNTKYAESASATSDIIINATDTTLTATATKEGNAVGISNASGGWIEVNGNLAIKADDAISVSGRSTTKVNKNKNSTVKIDGDVVFSTASDNDKLTTAHVELNLTDANSYLNGRIYSKTGDDKATDDDQTHGGMTLDLENGAVWNTTLDNIVDNLTVSGGTVNATSIEVDEETKNPSLTVGTLTMDSGEIDLGSTSGALDITEKATISGGEITANTLDLEKDALYAGTNSVLNVNNLIITDFGTSKTSRILGSLKATSIKNGTGTDAGEITGEDLLTLLGRNELIEDSDTVKGNTHTLYGVTSADGEYTWEVNLTAGTDGSLTIQNYSNTAAAGVQRNILAVLGENTIAVGNGAGASKPYNIAVGYSANASGEMATAIGRNSGANGYYSIAFGGDTRATGTAAMAFGYGSKANGDESTAIGWLAKAIGANTIAFGSESEASGKESVAIGHKTNTSGELSVAIGAYNSAEKTYDIAIGYNANASGSYSIAMGQSSAVSGYGGVGIGDYATVAGNYASAFGYKSNASGYLGNAIGAYSSVTGNYASALGYRSTASGYVSTAVGYSAQATGQWALALGPVSKATNNQTVAIGTSTQASGDSSTALGSYSIASEYQSVAVGYQASASGYTSTALGSASVASGTGATAAGYGAKASAFGATATGHGSEASGFRSSAYGNTAKATKQYAMAFGNETEATGDYSTVFGSRAVASGQRASTFGYQTKATGKNSVALGANSVASIENEVSFGHSKGDTYTDVDYNVKTYTSDLNRRLTHVAAGINLTDAVNVSQLTQVTVNDKQTAKQSTESKDGNLLLEDTYTGGEDEEVRHVFNIKLNDDIELAGEIKANSANLGGVLIGGGNITATTGTIGGVGLGGGQVTATQAVFGVPDDKGKYTNGYVAISSNGYIDATFGKIGGVGFENGNIAAKTATIGGITISGKYADGNSKIYGVEDGEISSTSKEAVNGSQLYAVQTELAEVNTKAGQHTEVTVNGGKPANVTSGNLLLTKTNTDGHDVYDVSLNDNVTLAGEIKANSANLGGVEMGGGNINAATGTIGGVGLGGGQVTAAQAVFGVPDADGKYTNGYVTISSNGYIDATFGKIGGVGLENGNIAAKTATIGGVTISAKDTDGNSKISGVADGEISSTSKEAVNGSQLYAVKESVGKLETNMTEVNSSITNLQTDVSSLKTDVTEVKSNITNLRTDVSSLQTDMTEVKSSVSTLQTQVTNNSTAITNLQNSYSENNTKVDQKFTDINEKIGDVNFSDTNYIDGMNLTEAAVKLDSQVKTNETMIAGESGTLDFSEVKNFDTKTDNLQSALKGLDSKLGSGEFVNRAETYTDAINANTAGIWRNSLSIHELGREIDSVGAISAALAGLHPLDYDGEQSKWQMSAGFGSYDGSSALALGGFYHPNENTLFSGGVSTVLKGERKTALNLGVTFRVGRGGAPSVTPEEGRVLAAENKKLADKVATQEKQIADQARELSAQKEKMAELEAKFEALLSRIR